MTLLENWSTGGWDLREVGCRHGDKTDELRWRGEGKRREEMSKAQEWFKFMTEEALNFVENKMLADVYYCV